MADLYFDLATAPEISLTLGQRLKAARLAQGLQQAELAARAGLSRGTVMALENQGQCSLQAFIHIVQALGLVQELNEVFLPQIRTIAEMERHAAPQRQRAPRKTGPQS
jgi:transcriptional regulator with XRE-family HTH domain